jgi:integrase/recombinase XerD
VRFVQVMLGHAQLTSTQIYTQVATRALKEIHTATHPARLERCDQHEQIAQAQPTRLLHRVYGKPAAIDATVGQDAQQKK